MARPIPNVAQVHETCNIEKLEWAWTRGFREKAIWSALHGVIWQSHRHHAYQIPQHLYYTVDWEIKYFRRRPLPTKIKHAKYFVYIHVRISTYTQFKAGDEN